MLNKKRCASCFNLTDIYPPYFNFRFTGWLNLLHLHTQTTVSGSQSHEPGNGGMIQDEFLNRQKLVLQYIFFDKCGQCTTKWDMLFKFMFGDSAMACTSCKWMIARIKSFLKYIENSWGWVKTMWNKQLKVSW